MKRNYIVKKLMSEGFSSKTLLNMSDKQLGLLSKKILGEQGTNPLASVPPVKLNMSDTTAGKNNDTIKKLQVTKTPYVVSEKEISETKDKNWIQKAVKKPGALHKDLDVPKGKKIPASELKAAAKKGGKVGQRARFAMNVKGLKEGEKTAEDTQFYDKETKGKKQVIEKDVKEGNVPVVNPGKEKKSKKEINEWLGNLIENDYHCATTKNEIMELIQSKLMEQEVPVKEPKIKEPGVKEKPGDPERRKLHDPWKKDLPGVQPERKMSAEPDVDVPVKEPEVIPSEPETPTKPGRPLHDPWKKNLPGVQPERKMKSTGGKEPMPSFLSLKSILNARKSHQLNETSSKIINLLKQNGKKGI